MSALITCFVVSLTTGCLADSAKLMTVTAAFCKNETAAVAYRQHSYHRMDYLTPFLLAVDPWLISPYRWPASATTGYLLGTLLLIAQCLLLGDLAATAVSYLNRRHLLRFQQEMQNHHNLSEAALRLGDKASFKAVNRQALDAFGHSFSLGAAIFSVSIWPLPFALAWLQNRFQDAPLELPWQLPIIGREIPYLASFVLLYIASRICYGTFMRRFAWYQRLKERLVLPAEMR